MLLKFGISEGKCSKKTKERRFLKARDLRLMSKLKLCGFFYLFLMYVI